MTPASDTDLLRALGARIRQARKDAGFRNVEQLSVRLNVASRTAQRWEQGLYEPSLSMLIRIAEVTGQPLSYFVAGLSGRDTEEAA